MYRPFSCADLAHLGQPEYSVLFAIQPTTLATAAGISLSREGAERQVKTPQAVVGAKSVSDEQTNFGTWVARATLRGDGRHTTIALPDVAPMAERVPGGSIQEVSCHSPVPSPESRPAATTGGFGIGVFGGIRVLIDGVQEVVGSNPTAPTSPTKPGPNAQTDLPAPARASALPAILPPTFSPPRCRSGSALPEGHPSN